MPATFQKTIDKTPENITNKFNFLDDILIIITKGTISAHKSDIKRVLKRLDEESLAIKLEKCEFARSDITWLGYNITQTGISPNTKKTDSIQNIEPPKTLKQLRSLMGSIHQLIKFIPNLASLLDPIRPLLKKENIINNKIQWSQQHTDALNTIKNQITKITEHKHFDKEKPTRVKCDASHKRLGATLEQWNPNGWFPIAYASRFLNTAEQIYSTNELELLAVVWATEHFRYYLYGSHFLIATDHKALFSALKTNRGNKSNYSRLTRWVDRLLPFSFKVQHLPGKEMGFTDYLSRHPNSPASDISKDDELFVVNRIQEFNFTLANEFRRSELSANRINPKRKPLQSDDVINHTQSTRAKQSAFCLNRLNKQSNLSNYFSLSQSSKSTLSLQNNNQPYSNTSNLKHLSPNSKLPPPQKFTLSPAKDPTGTQQKYPSKNATEPPTKTRTWNNHKTPTNTQSEYKRTTENQTSEREESQLMRTNTGHSLNSTTTHRPNTATTSNKC